MREVTPVAIVKRNGGLVEIRFKHTNTTLDCQTWSLPVNNLGFPLDDDVEYAEFYGDDIARIRNMLTQKYNNVPKVPTYASDKYGFRVITTNGKEYGSVKYEDGKIRENGILFHDTSEYHKYLEMSRYYEEKLQELHHERKKLEELYRKIEKLVNKLEEKL